MWQSSRLPDCHTTLGHTWFVAAIAMLAACSGPPVGSLPSDASGQAETSLDATSPVDQGTPIDELPPIDVAAASKLVIDLSDNEQMLLCDWNARQYGGYGGGLRCTIDASFPTILAPIGSNDCLSTLKISEWGRQCPLTVQDFMACVGWQVLKVCSVTDGGDWPPECLTQYGPLCIGGIGKEAAPDEAGDEADAGTAIDADASDEAATSDASASDATDGGPLGD